MRSGFVALVPQSERSDWDGQENSEPNHGLPVAQSGNRPKMRFLLAFGRDTFLRPKEINGLDAEVIGQVVGVAMRLGEWRTVDFSPEGIEREALN